MRGGFDSDLVDRAWLKMGAYLSTLAGNSPLHSSGRKSLVVLCDGLAVFFQGR